MADLEERLQAVVEKLNILEKHVKRHWIENNGLPDQEQIKILHEELQTAVKELRDVHKTIKVFKS